MYELKTDIVNHRISQLLGTLFLLIVVSGLIAARNEGAWHELGMSLVGGFLVLFVAVFVADQLIQKYNEERFNPHRDYVYSITQKAITEIFLKISPPIEKTELRHAEFGFYSSGYYNLLNLNVSYGDRFCEVFRGSATNVYDFDRAAGMAREGLDEFFTKTKSLSSQFFTILDPELLECFLHLEDAQNQLDIAMIDSGISLDSKVSLYSLCFVNILYKVYEMQNLLLSRATRCLSIQEWIDQIKSKEDRIAALSRR